MPAPQLHDVGETGDAGVDAAPQRVVGVGDHEAAAGAQQAAQFGQGLGGFGDVLEDEPGQRQIEPAVRQRGFGDGALDQLQPPALLGRQPAVCLREQARVEFESGDGALRQVLQQRLGDEAGAASGVEHVHVGAQAQLLEVAQFLGPEDQGLGAQALQFVLGVGVFAGAVVGGPGRCGHEWFLVVSSERWVRTGAGRNPVLTK